MQCLTSDTIWQHRTGSTMVQAMACCLTASSYYLNQCWLFNSETQWQSLQKFSQEIPQPPTLKICLEITYSKLYSNLPKAIELKKMHKDITCYQLLQSHCNHWVNTFYNHFPTGLSFLQEVYQTTGCLNPLHAKFCRRNINMYLQFI